jgi:hypothetical protein
MYSHEKIYQLPSEVMMLLDQHERVQREEKFKERIG